MSTFIKTGYWEKAYKGLKGWLDLDKLIRDTASSFPGGQLTQDELESIQGANAPSGLNPLATMSDVPSSDQLDAINNSNAPNASNPFATINDLGGGGVTDVTYDELVAAILGNSLVAGSYYRITDYQTVHYILDGNGDICLDAETNPVINTAAVEPIVVIASSSNTLASEATSELYPQDILYYDWNPENWKYDLAFAAYDEEVLTGFKGVIYFRHDTLNDVSMGHDWRKVLNRRWKRNDPIYDSGTTYALGDKVQVEGDGVYISMKSANTGNAVSSEQWWIKIIDYDITDYWSFQLSKAQDSEDYIDIPCFYSQEADPEDQYKREVFTVHLKPFKDDGSDWGWYYNKTILQNNVFALEPDYGWYQMMGISAEILCVNNTFAGYQDGNVLGAHFSYNSIGANFYDNSIGAYFANNSIGINFQYNSIGAYFYNNSIGINFQYNSIGAYFSYNSIGANFYDNSIGTSFYDNSIGTYFSYNSIGAGFNSNSIGDYTQNNTIGNNVQYLIIPSKTSGNGFRHNQIKDGFAGTSGAKIDFTSATHVFANYNCDLMMADNGNKILSYVDENTGSYTLTFVAATA